MWKLRRALNDEQGGMAASEAADIMMAAEVIVMVKVR